MPRNEILLVKNLKLDLQNFRTVPQKSEIAAVRAMISVNPDWFWALAESLLDDGYLLTENILVLESGKELTVKEGNRRVAILKLLLGQVQRRGITLPSHLQDRLAKLSEQWREENGKVPCAVYSAREKDAVDKIITLTHGKSEKAGRDKWRAVARARHNRDANGVSEPSLDLLEAYLNHGKNLTGAQGERWAGDYPLTVLEEVMKRVAVRFGAATAKELAEFYPAKCTYRDGLEDILRDIGLGKLGFEQIRDKSTDFALTSYGIPAISSPSTTKPSTAKAAKGGGSQASTSASGKARAVAIDDARAVKRQLSRFQPVGNNRAKVVTLLREARKLKLDVHPHAFCFVLRSMFEISAKAYCDDHAKSGGPCATKANGDDRSLVDVLRDITTHLTQNSTDKQMTKRLHGAMAELAKSSGFLSVTSMNQLVHNPKFSVKDTHISALFGNIFPLLEAMNA